MTRGDRGGFSDRRRLEQFQMLARGVCGERGIEEKDADIPGGARWGPGVQGHCHQARPMSAGHRVEK